MYKDLILSLSHLYNKVCQVDYVHLEADLGYILSYKNLWVGFQMNIINLTYFTVTMYHKQM